MGRPPIKRTAEEQAAFEEKKKRKRRETVASSRERNRETINDTQQNMRVDNRAQTNQQRQTYRNANREQTNASQHEYRNADREQTNANQRAYRAAALQRRVQALQRASIETHSFGLMNEECSHCKAKHFKSEYKNKNGTYSSCCAHGQIATSLFNWYAFPQELKSLLKGEHEKSQSFLKDCRRYNKAVAMAGIVTKEISMSGKCPYTYRQHGEFQRAFNCSAAPTENSNERPSNGQLFMIESDEANGIRANINKKLDANILALLDGYVRQNPCGKSYMMLKEEQERAQNNANAANSEPPAMKLLFSLKKGVDMNRYNMPRTNEIAACMLKAQMEKCRHHTLLFMSETNICRQFLS